MFPIIKLSFQLLIEEYRVEFVADVLVLSKILFQPLGIALDVIEQLLVDISENRDNSP